MVAVRESSERTQLSILPRTEGVVLQQSAPSTGQDEISRAIVNSVLRGSGLTFTVSFAHRREKNLLSTQIEALLLTLHMRSGGIAAKVAPAFAPYGPLSVYRLRCQLHEAGFVEGPDGWTCETAHGMRLRAARQLFLSAKLNNKNLAGPGLYLLEVDEAQDITLDTFIQSVRPIGAGVTTVLYGSAWSTSPLMEQVRRENTLLFQQDGLQRNFHLEIKQAALMAS